MATQSEKAKALFDSGFNCAQSVVAVFSEKYGLSKSHALKVASGFGGGLRCGEVCGAAAGAAMVIGLRDGQFVSYDKETKQFCNEKTVEFMRRFREANQSIVCRDLLGIDISTDENRAKAAEQGLFKTVCVDMVTSAVVILEAMGY